MGQYYALHLLRDVGPRRKGGLTRRGENVAEKPKRAVAFEEINGRDQGAVRPRIHLQTALTAKFGKQLRIDDGEIEAEFLAHLIAPVDLQLWVVRINPIRNGPEPLSSRLIPSVLGSRF